MHLTISIISEIPIYEQIKNQIREKVLSKDIEPETMLPSIRTMARELKVGIITVKRAYQDLCEEGLLVSQPGKGVFVASLDVGRIKEKHMRIISDQLKEIQLYAEGVDIGRESLIQLLEDLYKEN